jgi:hypothetical protein
MRKISIRTLTALVLGMALVLPAYASEKGHGAMKGTDHPTKTDHPSKMDHSGHMGEMIHESTVDGYQLAYHLIDMKAKMKAMMSKQGSESKGSDTKSHDMSQLKSHHLMVFITGPDGKKLTDAKVGYKVEGPGGSEQKTMAMAMKGGFGADVDMEAAGTYEIKTKAMAGDKKLIDEFTYQVE